MDISAAAEPIRSGRKPVTTKEELSHVALALFNHRGFDRVTVDDIAAAAGIGRRTFFRYFASKNDLPWGDFEALLERMAEYLRSLPAEQPLIAGLCSAVIEFNRFPPEEAPFHRQRMELLLHVPTLLAHSTLRYAAWRQVVAEHVAQRLDVPEDSLKPQAIAWGLLGLCLAAYEQWLRSDASDLTQLLRESLKLVDGVGDRP
ncbi:mycofactocin system transcriptional regulator [Arthrobacter sp. zg-Y820]|uniref:mycofactocin system transcriptional regulator n=1 Tax=unclassified Arthrobacter TaxID=235627 RepID=UPI001E340A28|nr:MULTISPECIES: mycofactocin system transcriptional regulator [unclassified Arthrobacter]MCC9196861.1 mycofactocin system transcriptional regulator [Arthrobacter sp. zg-Y820]MDK1279725.1 mycofactocin system transcriptional regulator [Arthrobacter sp. zg.Y820]WIB11017.1 mycofactocin system transcriptional regulator [Arthrobacter sp. zg-Y820]